MCRMEDREPVVFLRHDPDENILPVVDECLCRQMTILGDLVSPGIKDRISRFQKRRWTFVLSPRTLLFRRPMKKRGKNDRNHRRNEWAGGRHKHLNSEDSIKEFQMDEKQLEEEAQEKQEKKIAIKAKKALAKKKKEEKQRKQEEKKLAKELKRKQKIEDAEKKKEEKKKERQAKDAEKQAKQAEKQAKQAEKKAKQAEKKRECDKGGKSGRKRKNGANAGAPNKQQKGDACSRCKNSFASSTQWKGCESCEKWFCNTCWLKERGKINRHCTQCRAGAYMSHDKI